MSEHPNATRIRSLFAAFRARDLDTIRAALAEDAIWHFPGRTGKIAGAHVGHGGILAFLARVMELTGGTFGLEIETLLADEDRAVRLSATMALARLDRPEAISGLAKAFTLDFGAEGGVDRTGAVRAALLRSALARFPDQPQTAVMIQAGRTDADPAVRFIALAGARPAGS